MKYTRKDYEDHALVVRSARMKNRKGLALQYGEMFAKDNPRFNWDRFLAACMVYISKTEIDLQLKHKGVEVELRSIKFSISYRWTKADVDAAIVPHLSVLCGDVRHEVGKADLLNGEEYDSGEADKTPLADSISELQDHIYHAKWPKDVEITSQTGVFIQGYSDTEFEYTGPLARMGQVIEECKLIITKLIQRVVVYHEDGDKMRNSKVNAFAGPGFDARRIL